MPLTLGENQFNICIFLPSIGENIFHRYVIIVNRAAADVDLKTLRTNVGTRTEPFVPAVTDYTINVDPVYTLDIRRAAVTDLQAPHISYGAVFLW